MLRIATTILILAIGGEAMAAEREVVLVVGSASPVTQLSPLEIRKLFLALPVIRDGRQLRPIRNSSDHQLVQVFLQHVVAMSQSAYDRRILTQVLQQGRVRPTELNQNEQVLAALYADRHAVSYMWLQDVSGNPRVRILRVLWTE